jgi:hypothetical protein
MSYLSSPSWTHWSELVVECWWQSSLLLAIALLALRLLRSPAARIAVTRATLVALSSLAAILNLASASVAALVSSGKPSSQLASGWTPRLSR